MRNLRHLGRVASPTPGKSGVWFAATELVLPRSNSCPRGQDAGLEQERDSTSRFAMRWSGIAQTADPESPRVAGIW